MNFDKLKSLLAATGLLLGCAHRPYKEHKKSACTLKAEGGYSCGFEKEFGK